jgi:hypothetical protein
LLFFSFAASRSWFSAETSAGSRFCIAANRGVVGLTVAIGVQPDRIRTAKKNGSLFMAAAAIAKSCQKRDRIAIACSRSAALAVRDLCRPSARRGDTGQSALDRICQLFRFANGSGSGRRGCAAAHTATRYASDFSAIL